MPKQTAAQRAWYIRNREVAISRSVEYNRTHRKERKRICTKWRKNNKERVNLVANQWLEQHPSFVNHHNMLNRCFNKKTREYHRYGGRGVTVYPPWCDFSVYEREFGYLKPGIGYTVNRLNDDGDYEPRNVEWVTRSENSSRKGKIYASV